MIAASDGGERPVGVAVGPFVSVSLIPPLVAFFRDKTSTGWPRIELAGRFCVNVLASDQEAGDHPIVTGQVDAMG